MPGKVGVKIKAARNLPVMDKSSETTDAFVEIKLANKEHKTEVFRKSLNPTWNTDWYVAPLVRLSVIFDIWFLQVSL